MMDEKWRKQVVKYVEGKVFNGCECCLLIQSQFKSVVTMLALKFT